MKQSWKIIVFVVAAMILTCSVFGQSDVSTATLSGTVLDPNNAPIAGASVTVTNVEKGISKDTISDEQGDFRVPLLQPGKYEIRVESRGFQTYRGQNIVLTIGQDAIVDIPLKLGEVATVVTVDTELPLIETTKTQQANTIEQRQIESLPNVNRSYTDIVFTLPGVVSNQDTYTQASSRAIERIAPTSGISIGGTTGRNNYVSIDGGENDIGSGGLRIKDLSIEAVQEYQVNRNGFNAEFGFTTGTALNVVTKSGTNTWR
ncbi:MAG: carboxypeptidase-like regulatory domain-containing protein, partial [Acidobacteriota bacterium]